ncbi:KH domain-containing protein [Ignicoccus hospitalis]|uniref:KH domain-containing protein n=1 Tax=Ignicoccus hospitalis TaxID=160233 RepID=UPI0006972894|nr:KH domain-containing protein [Ignicoccus hospitalis]HIH89877.1 RNA-processing protein [Desulfurococcaceae archaeon]
MSASPMRFYLGLPPETLRKLMKRKDLLEEAMRLTKTNIRIEGGRVIIEPTDESTSLDLLNAKNLLQAIALGFDIETASLLLRDEYVMEIIDLRDVLFSRKDDKELRRILGRVIGKHGKAKRNIEEIAKVKLSISDGIIAIIGEYENVEAAKRAIEELIEGKMHSTVYRNLETSMRYLKRRNLTRYWEEFP